MNGAKRNGDFLLLTDPARCPKCYARRLTCDYCPACGIRLFSKPIEFAAFETGTGIRNWWCWHPSDGWKHRDHWMVDTARPNHCQYQLPDLPKDYGRQTTPGEVAQAPLQQKRKNREVLK